MLLFSRRDTSIISLIKYCGTGMDALTVVPFKSEKLLSMIFWKTFSMMNSLPSVKQNISTVAYLLLNFNSRAYKAEAVGVILNRLQMRLDQGLIKMLSSPTIVIFIA